MGEHGLSDDFHTCEEKIVPGRPHIDNKTLPSTALNLLGFSCCFDLVQWPVRKADKGIEMN